jgi:hypothetical protein
MCFFLILKQDAILNIFRYYLINKKYIYVYNILYLI